MPLSELVEPPPVHKHDRMVRNLVRALYSDGHILKPDQARRFATLCVKTDLSLQAAVRAFNDIHGQQIRGKTLIRDGRVESSYRVFLQAMNILADYIMRGLEAGRDVSTDHLEDDANRQIYMWTVASWRLVVDLMVVDCRWQVITPTTVRRIVAAVDALTARASQRQLAEWGRIDQRTLHRWSDFRFRSITDLRVTTVRKDSTKAP